jgi:hypothetical protein
MKSTAGPREKPLLMKNLKKTKTENTTTKTTETTETNETKEIKEIQENKEETISTINNNKDSALEAGSTNNLKPCLISSRSPQV